VPIAYALHHPERAELPVAPLDLPALGALTFEAPDLDTFPCLRLAREAGEAGGTAPCILNAANEVAVHAFLNGRLRFSEIAEVIARTLDAVPAGRVHAFETLYRADREAREAARQVVEQAGQRPAVHERRDVARHSRNAGLDAPRR
jgi:1-deoxy-D-xylulose-5-phosphate reductoisomerase